MANSSLVTLVFAPSFNDGMMAVDVLKSADVEALACRDAADLCRRVVAGCGAVVISEEALTPDSISQLQAVLENQESWSDLPMILLTSADVITATELFAKSGNISLLERPFSRLTLVRSVQVALRSRLKQYEVRDLLTALKSSKDEAERANLAKSQFLANMSHEIRTPIGVIMGFIELMKKSEAGGGQEYMGIVDRNSQHLLRLIDDILDLSKVEAGKMAIEHHEFPLKEFLSDLVLNMKFKAVQKGLAFEVNFQTAIPDRIITDSGRLRQILSNVVGNAIKFTERGKIEIDIGFEDSHLKFVVRDTGIGLNTDQIANLFQPFAQADSSTTRKFGGTGLGLVLSRRLSEALGGDLNLEWSRPSGGSSFVIRVQPELPRTVKMTGDIDLEQESPRRESASSARLLHGLKILLVEDSPDNQELISTYLRHAGATVEIESNGADGGRSALKHNFDVILMDLQMPIRDGHEATRLLRKQGYPKPILALTAHAMQEERAKCFVSGFTDYITKPIDFELLIRTLSRYHSLNDHTRDRDQGDFSQH